MKKYTLNDKDFIPSMQELIVLFFLAFCFGALLGNTKRRRRRKKNTLTIVKIASKSLVNTNYFSN